MGRAIAGSSDGHRAPDPERSVSSKIAAHVLSVAFLEGLDQARHGVCPGRHVDAQAPRPPAVAVVTGPMLASAGPGEQPAARAPSRSQRLSTVLLEVKVTASMRPASSSRASLDDASRARAASRRRPRRRPRSPPRAACPARRRARAPPAPAAPAARPRPGAPEERSPRPAPPRGTPSPRRRPQARRSRRAPSRGRWPRRGRGEGARVGPGGLERVPGALDAVGARERHPRVGAGAQTAIAAPAARGRAGRWISMVGTTTGSAPRSRRSAAAAPACSRARVTSTRLPKSGRRSNHRSASSGAPNATTSGSAPSSRPAPAPRRGGDHDALGGLPAAARSVTRSPGGSPAKGLGDVAAPTRTARPSTPAKAPAAPRAPTPGTTSKGTPAAATARTWATTTGDSSASPGMARTTRLPSRASAMSDPADTSSSMTTSASARRWAALAVRRSASPGPPPTNETIPVRIPRASRSLRRSARGNAGADDEVRAPGDRGDQSVVGIESVDDRGLADVRVGERVEGPTPEGEGPGVSLGVAREVGGARDAARRLVNLPDGRISASRAYRVVAGSRAARGEEGEEIARARPRQLRGPDVGDEGPDDVEREGPRVDGAEVRRAVAATAGDEGVSPAPVASWE